MASAKQIVKIIRGRIAPSDAALKGFVGTSSVSHCANVRALTSSSPTFPTASVVPVGRVPGSAEPMESLVIIGGAVSKVNTAPSVSRVRKINKAKPPS